MEVVSSEATGSQVLGHVSMDRTYTGEVVVQAADASEVWAIVEDGFNDAIL